MEHAIGSIVTLPDGRKAKVVEGEKCKDCFLHDLLVGDCHMMECRPNHRKDNKNIIYKEIKEEKQ